MRAYLSVALCLASTSLAALHSLPDDTYAFPKYRVSFLNGHPVLNETAERWLKEGLRGGELEFLDQPWEDATYTSPPQRKEIGQGDDAQQPLLSSDSSPHTPEEHTLEHMKMGPRDSYICLIPKPLEITNTTQDEEVEDMSPARSWSLLQSLSGTCLYHRQGWFTYSYCHNDEIRQFKEAAPTQTRFPGTYKPDEDPEWDAYTLGRAPRNPEPGADLTVAEQNAQAANLELARTAGSRYLVQRWGDGTVCDKTNAPREVEVQFHCSMEMTDHILFVKETKTCSYVLVIHTPRLCSEPGFQSKREGGEGAEILCREVVDVLPAEGPRLPKADHPLKVPLRKTVLPAPAPKSDKAKTPGSDDKQANKEKLFSDLLRQTLEALAASGVDATHKGDGSGGEFVIELDDDATADDIDDDRIVAALRAAGYNVQAEVIKVDPREGKGKNDKGKSDKGKSDTKGASDKKQAKKFKRWL